MQLSLCMIALTVGYHTRGGEAFFVREPQSKNSCYHTRGGPSDTKGAWDILHKEGYPKQRDIYHILHALSYTLGRAIIQMDPEEVYLVRRWPS